jgi:hypothetical protein
MVKLDPSDITLDLGFNYRFNFKKWSISSEIKYLKAVTNVANDKESEMGLAMKQLNRNEFSFSLYIRGPAKD